MKIKPHTSFIKHYSKYRVGDEIVVLEDLFEIGKSKPVFYKGEIVTITWIDLIPELDKTIEINNQGGWYLWRFKHFK